MKQRGIIVLFTIAGMLSLNLDARADDEGWAALGGFLGGIIFSSMADDYYYTKTVVHKKVVVEQPMERGHYEYEVRQKWIPACWSYEEDSCGNVVRVWRRGYYKDYYVKTWVSHTRPRGIRYTKYCRY